MLFIYHASFHDNHESYNDQLFKLAPSSYTSKLIYMIYVFLSLSCV